MFTLVLSALFIFTGCISSNVDTESPVVLESRSTTIECPLEFKKQPFTRIGLYDGMPNENVHLAPSNGNSKYPPNWIVATNDLWVTCQYGPKSKNLIQKKITMEVSNCGTEESRKGSGQFNLINCL